MTTLQILSERANAALSRLASLQERAKRVTGPVNGVVRAALKELTDALDELQVANEQLQAQGVELSAAKAVAGITAQRLDELLDVMPFSCVWTDGTGEIVEANRAAAALFNVSRQHLAGRPLILFLADRTAMMDALGALAAGIAHTVDFSAVVRPRERRVRPVQISGRRLESDNRICWFLLEQKGAAPTISEPA